MESFAPEFAHYWLRPVGECGRDETAPGRKQARNGLHWKSWPSA
jgi:hypothetical protein